MDSAKTNQIQAICPLPLTLIWHENRRIYFSAHQKKKHLILRLHRLFLAAPTPVLEALIQMALYKDPKSRMIVRKMAHLYFTQNRMDPKPLPSRGVVYDLQEIYNRLKEEHFDPSYNALIGWSPSSRRGRFRSMTFGTYDRHLHQIRIHPLLDDRGVPLYFLEFIVYHEMLHAVCASFIDSAGRCRVHTREFREKEKRFPLYEAAKEWEKKSLNYFKTRKLSHGRP